MLDLSQMFENVFFHGAKEIPVLHFSLYSIFGLEPGNFLVEEELLLVFPAFWVTYQLAGEHPLEGLFVSGGSGRLLLAEGTGSYSRTCRATTSS